MKGVNKAIVVGVVGQDPEINTTTQSQIVKISVATNEKWKDPRTGEDKEETEWHRVVFFAKLAEIAGQYLKKGDKVYVEGRIKTAKYTDKEGIERQATQIIGNNLQMLSSLSGSKLEPQQQKQSNSSGYGDYKRRREAPPTKAQNQATEEFYNDAVPF